MQTLVTTIPLVEIQCGNCGTFHAIPQGMYDKCVEEGGFWTCPNGHSRGFKQGRHERDAVVRERDMLKQQLAQRDDVIADLQRSVASEQRKITKLKTRASAGVCPCCNRHFPNLASHMKTKHKDYGT